METHLSEQKPVLNNSSTAFHQVSEETEMQTSALPLPALVTSKFTAKEALQRHNNILKLFHFVLIEHSFRIPKYLAVIPKNRQRSNNA